MLPEKDTSQITHLYHPRCDCQMRSLLAGFSLSSNGHVKRPLGRTTTLCSLGRAPPNKLQCLPKDERHVLCLTPNWPSGEGGMATVYLADDLKHKRKVVLKEAT